MTSVKAYINTVYSYIKPYKDVLWFLFLFFFFDFLWKLLTDESINHDTISVLGKDITQSIEPINRWIAQNTYWVVHSLLGFSDYKINGTLIYFEGSLKFDIVWGCTGIKQMIMLTFIMLFYYGPTKKKVWYIPLSLLFIYLLNIARIVAVVFITKGGFPEWFIQFNEWYSNRIWDDSVRTYWTFYLDWFELFHRDILGWFYYIGGMFLVWLLWQEKFNLPYRKQIESSEKTKASANESL